jgi:NAD(P)H-nitrite reductase large subunit
MSEHLDGAILQRDKKTYAIVPRTPAGLVDPETLEKIAAVARKYEVPVIKITSGQRIALVGFREEDLAPAWRDLGLDIGRATELCLHYVQACPGNSVCRYGMRDSLGSGLEIEKILTGMELPAKLKIGISGCPMSCGESLVRDIGLIGSKKGWTVSFGGNAGSRVRSGDKLAAGLDDEEAKRLVVRLAEFYRANGKKRERAARFVERVGIEAVKEAVL